MFLVIRMKAIPRVNLTGSMNFFHRTLNLVSILKHWTFDLVTTSTQLLELAPVGKFVCFLYSIALSNIKDSSIDYW